jgi:beta-N-acetylglucosaminidase
MSRKAPEFTTTVTIRLTDQDKEDLTRLCEALNVTKSEFLRNKVSNINNHIMKNNLFNIPQTQATDAWGRNIAKEKIQQAKAEKSFKEQMNEEFNSQLLDKLTNVSANEVVPFSTPNGVLDQLKKRK